MFLSMTLFGLAVIGWCWLYKCLCRRPPEDSLPTTTTAQPRPPRPRPRPPRPTRATRATHVQPAEPRPLLPTTTGHVLPQPAPLPREPTAKSTCFKYGLMTAKCCAICLEEYGEEDHCEMLTECHHMYHHHCIQQWRATKLAACAYCPLCRVPLAMEASSYLSQLSHNQLG